MGTRILGAFLVVIGLTALASDVVEGHKRHRGGVSVSIDSDDLTSCGDMKVTFHGLETARAEEERVLPGASVSRLEVRPHKNGGAYIRGWDRSDYSILACKASGDETQAAAERQLAGVRLVVSGNRVSIEGPTGGDWVGYLLIRAPQNGPLNVCLKGARWDGELEAHTQNGPINLEVPEGYQSGVRVDASRHSQVECDAPQCRQAVRTWENPNRIQFGGGSPVIRLSTVNGPVMIGGGKARQKEL